MLKPTLGIAAAAAAVAVTVPLASAPAAPSRTLTFKARLDRHSLAQLDTRPKGPSAGDQFVFSAGLRRAGHAAGRAEFVQTAVDNRYQGLAIRADLLLRDGSLELQGAGLRRRAPGTQKPSAQSDLAVVGGTGAYADASGTARLVDTGRFTKRVTIDLAG